MPVNKAACRHQRTDMPAGGKLVISALISYCYANGYTLDRISPKEGFEKLVDRDVSDLEEFNVPPAPVHLSNSTDPLQEGLESRFRHTRYALEKLLAHRRRFTTTGPWRIPRNWSGGAAAVVQVAMLFCIAAGHISLASVKEEVISPVEIVKNIPQALRDVYERFRKI